MYSTVESEPKDVVATIEREFKFRKRMTLFVLGTNNQSGPQPELDINFLVI